VKIYTIVDLKSDWCPKNLFLSFKKYSNLEFVDNPTSADLVWIFSYYTAPSHILLLPPITYKILPFLKARRKKIFSNLPIVTTIHHLTPQKQQYWQENVRLLDQVTDAWQTFSNHNLHIFNKFMKKPIHVLPYWIDTNNFFPLSKSDRQQLKHNYQLPTNKIIIGSFQRDTEADETSPKLEKGPDVFCDIVEKLDPNKYFVLLSGPRRHYIKKRFTEKNIPFKSLDKIPYEKMNDLYNMLDYYLITSRYEGGPQAILEAMATKTRIYSTKVGISNTLSPSTIFNTPNECITKLKQPYPDEILNKHYIDVQSFECKKVVPQFENFFSQLISHDT
jgi:glycosyltransferase involved in cell wall biosynthesis